MAKSIKYLLTYKTSIVLIIVNLIPLIGVLYFDWQLFIIVMLYWLENVVIGAISALKMLSTYGALLVKKIFMTGFFSVHYGFFCFIHGSILVDIFGNEDSNELNLAKIISDNGLYVALAALFASHFFSYIQNFILNGERKKQNLSDLMAAPYARIFVLHVFILAGGLLLNKFGENQFGLLALTSLKILIDLITHRSEHKKIAQKSLHN